MLTGLDAGDSIVIAKSFSHMLNLANLAEEVQIAYRRRIKLLKMGDFADENSAITESDIEETFKRLVTELKKSPQEVFDALKKQIEFFLDHPGAAPITTVQGEELRKLIGALVYIECSSKTQQNVKAVFDAAIKVVLQPPKQKKKKRKVFAILYLCCITHDGVGVPETLLNQMFGREGQESEEGISLLISRKLLKLMNGDVRYLRDVGKSSFILTVELAASQILIA
ncbi:hypothetical protein HN51_011576 [Arachis hypogaea]